MWQTIFTAIIFYSWPGTPWGLRPLVSNRSAATMLYVCPTCSTWLSHRFNHTSHNIKSPNNLEISLNILSLFFPYFSPLGPNIFQVICLSFRSTISFIRFTLSSFFIFYLFYFLFRYFLPSSSSICHLTPRFLYLAIFFPHFLHFNACLFVSLSNYCTDTYHLIYKLLNWKIFCAISTLSYFEKRPCSSSTQIINYLLFAS
jgi:hypothetical protein